MPAVSGREVAGAVQRQHRPLPTLRAVVASTLMYYMDAATVDKGIQR